jgi:hypothetical protein
MVRLVINRGLILSSHIFRSIMLNYKNRNQKVLTNVAIPVDTAVPGERKLILKRLKPPPPHLSVWLADVLLFLAIVSVTGAIGIKKALLFTAGLFRKPELVRHVAPGKPPEPEYSHRKPTLF